MPQPESKYISSSQRVNRRTALKQALPQQALNPAVQERLIAAKLRGRMGSPLAEQLRGSGAARRAAALPTGAVLGGIVGAASGVGLFLSLLQSSLPLAGLGIGGIVVGGAMIWRSHRANAPASSMQQADLIDEEAVQALDRMLERVVSEVPDDVVIRLTGIKQLIVRIAQQARTAAVTECFTIEDRLYVRECVRRYLPDTLESYLRVAVNQRLAPVLEAGQTAHGLLLGQLDLLRAQLASRETKMARSSAEELLRQQRFLKSKGTG